MIRGEVAYRNGHGLSVGRERFEMIGHAEGYLVRALCELDEASLLRDVSLSLDHQWRPRDGFCRVLRDGQTLASALFVVEPAGVRHEAIHGELGSLSETTPTEGPLHYLGLHPLVGDALITQVAPKGAAGQFQTVKAITNSVSPNGDLGLQATPVDIDVAWICDEILEVAAGRFAARRYALRWNPDWPAADLWVREQDGLFLLMKWALIDTWYELDRLHEDRPLLPPKTPGRDL